VGWMMAVLVLCVVPATAHADGNGSFCRANVLGDPLCTVAFVFLYSPLLVVVFLTGFPILMWRLFGKRSPDYSTHRATLAGISCGSIAGAGCLVGLAAGIPIDGIHNPSQGYVLFVAVSVVTALIGYWIAVSRSSPKSEELGFCMHSFST
jgi:hypothetical protein